MTQSPGGDGDGSGMPGNGSGNGSGNETSSPASTYNGASIIIPGAILAPLPNIPLTAAPDADSEPLLAPGSVSTIESFSLVRDPFSSRDMIDNSDALTDEDFAQGPLPAVTLTPDSVNPTTNAPPYFVDLDDVEVFAGENLVVRFKPRDPDGDVPGMFIEQHPEGSQFIDNFDGSKSLHWRPLQPDAGIHEFMITAIDPVEPLYRTTRNYPHQGQNTQ